MKKLLIALLLCNACNSFAQSPVTAGIKTPNAAIDNFMDLRFGMFIHFGPVTLRGTEIGWSRNYEVPSADYDNLYKEFKPILFNADEWVKTAKTAGVKYLTITAKHHDGFCLWPTAYSTYNISQSPYKRDIVGALAKACKKYDVVFCIYFTVLDWHDEDYPEHRNAKDPKVKGDMAAFVSRMKNELKELITSYRPAMLWFDGNWEEPWKVEYARDVYAYIKSLDKNIIVNNRLGKGEPTKFSDISVGDYLTPEQQIGQLNMNDPWESCITICKQWAWKPNDEMKSLKECLQTLAKTAGGNGNLLFNVGPMPDGRIEQRQVNRLKEMGDWLNTNGQAIYGTLGGPYPPNDNYATTRKGNKIFIHVFKQSAELVLPGLQQVSVKNASLINGAKLNFKQSTDNISITLPETLPDENDTVIVLEVDKNAESLPVVKS